MFKIPANYYTLNAGNIDFTNYPNGIEKDFESIKIVNLDPLISLPVNFNEFKDITPENLKLTFEKLGQALKDVQERLSNVGMYIDSKLPGEIGLPKLPIGCTWYCNQDGHITAIPISSLYEKFQEMMDNLYNQIKERLDKDYDAFMANFLKEVEKIKEQLKTEVSKYAKDQVDDHVDNVSKPEIDDFVDIKKEEIDEYVRLHRDDLKGEKGDRGASITKIKFKELAPNRSNVYTVWAEDNIVGDITAPIGPHGDSIKGDKGEPGESIKGDKGDSIKSIVFNKTTNDGNVYDVLLNTGANIGQIIAPKGAKGDSIKGDKGDSIKGDTGNTGTGFTGVSFNKTTEEGNVYDTNLDNGKKGGQIIAPRGPKGDSIVGPIGPQGNNGIVADINGLFAFQVENGRLICYYETPEPPRFKIENGHLIYEYLEESGGGASTRDNLVEVFPGINFGYTVISWNGTDLEITSPTQVTNATISFLGIKNPYPTWYRLTYENDDNFDLGKLGNYFEEFKVIKEGREKEYRFRYLGKVEIRFFSKNYKSHTAGWTTTLRNLKIIELKDENEVIDD